MYVAYSDGSGTNTFDEFKSVFSAEIGPDAIPFNFDWCVLPQLCEHWTRWTEYGTSDWVKLHLGKKSGAHILGCMRLLCRCYCGRR
jgi:solute carrier family 25 aspartate/glutamate transporter 12/13